MMEKEKLNWKPGFKKKQDKNNQIRALLIFEVATSAATASSTRHSRGILLEAKGDCSDRVHSDQMVL
jgi:hypothetical protein